ncbi:hypothetical protein PG994_004476 [Apiospora phragmitis]|uniref:Uncharacterized protein n=1 Tax=Apiospora phragmitis TaxID=2905665 RepID=A0ABR1VQT3_9PEZI
MRTIGYHGRITVALVNEDTNLAFDEKDKAARSVSSDPTAFSLTKKVPPSQKRPAPTETTAVITDLRDRLTRALRAEKKGNAPVTTSKPPNKKKWGASKTTGNAPETTSNATEPTGNATEPGLPSGSTAEKRTRPDDDDGDIDMDTAPPPTKVQKTATSAPSTKGKKRAPRKAVR